MKDNIMFYERENDKDIAIIKCSLEDMNDLKRREELIDNSGLSRDTTIFSFMGSDIWKTR